jgi:hypothetical protein
VRQQESSILAQSGSTRAVPSSLILVAALSLRGLRLAVFRSFDSHSRTRRFRFEIRDEAISGDVILEGENEWLLAEWRYASEIPAYHRVIPSNTIFPIEEPRYEAHWTHLHFGDGTGEGIMSSVTPSSTAEELNAARNINLPCLMSGRGCHSLCDLLPDATRYRREHNGGGWGWNSGDWGIQPHDCN